jgi:hypothetical protein
MYARLFQLFYASFAQANALKDIPKDSHPVQYIYVFCLSVCPKIDWDLGSPCLAGSSLSHKVDRALVACRHVLQ